MLFSEYFNIEHDKLVEYGAVDISLSSDTRLYIDPSLIYFNDDGNIASQYQNIVKYLLMLRYKKQNSSLDINSQEIYFPEIKQNWLGDSKAGNCGRAVGKQFAGALLDKIEDICNTHNISNEIHLEKLLLIGNRVGKDKISDIVTNILLEFFINYTEAFAIKYLKEDQYCQFSIAHGKYDFDIDMFMDVKAYLPFIERNGKRDFILLTPKSILRMNDQAINKLQMHKDLYSICTVLDNAELRDRVIRTYNDVINSCRKAKEALGKNFTGRDQQVAITNAYDRVVTEYPILFDYYIKHEENQKDITVNKAYEEREILRLANAKKSWESSGLLDEESDRVECELAIDECKHKIEFFKKCIEVNGFYKVLYNQDEKPKNEKDIQAAFMLIWDRRTFELSPETNSGNGAVDFKVSKGVRNACNIEFKVASNPKLMSAGVQAIAYELAQNIKLSYIVIFFFTEAEEIKSIRARDALTTDSHKVILVDCRKDNKKSASKLKA